MTILAAEVATLLAETTWPDVAIALIVSIPSIIGAIVSLRIRKQIQTPSGASIGKQVEDTQHITLANHYRIRKLDDDAPRAVPTGIDEVEPRFRP